MAYFREIFCSEGTANTLCNVPVGGGVVFPNGTGFLFQNETAWCKILYDATNCTAIRDEAQQDMLTFSYIFYNVNAGWGLLLVLLVSFVILICAIAEQL